MDSLRLFLERNAQALVIFFACLTFIVVVIRPFSMALVEYLHRREVKASKKRTAAKPAKPLEGEMEELLGKATSMGLTDQEKIRRLAQSDPDRAKDLVLSWIYGEDSSGR